jgi:hypothetical protein
MLAGLLPVGQGVVESGHGGASLRLPLRHFQDHALALPGKLELVEVAPAGAGGLGI